LCISTGIPLPLLYTEIWFFSRSMETLIVSMEGSLICVSDDGQGTHFVVRGVDQDLVKDLEKTGNERGVAVVRSVRLPTHRKAIILVSESKTHICWVIASTEPMYVSGRFKTCSSWVSWYQREPD
jgi:hypothetical protein